MEILFLRLWWKIEEINTEGDYSGRGNGLIDYGI